MAEFHIKVGDTAPPITGTLENGAGQVISLAGIQSVRFVMRAIHGATAPKVNGFAIVDNAAGGVVHYDWQPIDTDTPGGYKGEWVVTFAGGQVERFPNDRNLTIAVHRRLDVTV